MTVITRAISRWFVRRGERQWSAQCLKISSRELAAAGITTDRFATIEISENQIVVRPVRLTDKDINNTVDLAGP